MSTRKCRLEFKASADPSEMLMLVHPDGNGPITFQLDMDLDVTSIVNTKFNYSFIKIMAFDYLGVSLLQYIAKIRFPDRQCKYVTRGECKTNLRATNLNFKFKL